MMEVAAAAGGGVGYKVIARVIMHVLFCAAHKKTEELIREKSQR